MATSFLKENLADRLIVILAPKIVGTGINAVGDLGIRRMDDALGFSFQRIIRRGADLILDARFNRQESDQPLRRPDPVEGGADDPPGVTGPLPAGKEPRHVHALTVLAPEDPDRRGGPGLHADQMSPPR